MSGRHHASSRSGRQELWKSVDCAVQITANTIKVAGASLFALAAIETAVVEPAPPQVGNTPISPQEQARSAVGANRFSLCELLGITVTEAPRYAGDLTPAVLTIRTKMDPEAARYMGQDKPYGLEWTKPDFVARKLITRPDGSPEVVANSAHYLDATDQPEAYKGFLPPADSPESQMLGVFVAYSATTLEDGAQTTTESEQYCGSIGRDAASSWQVIPPHHIPTYTNDK
jgi:hypothetical protein